MCIAVVPENPIVAAREARGLSVEELAVLAGVTGRDVRRLEAGRPDAGKVYADRMYAIADALDAPL